jgi:hypothetical protein
MVFQKYAKLKPSTNGNRRYVASVMDILQLFNKTLGSKSFFPHTLNRSYYVTLMKYFCFAFHFVPNSNILSV